jgi:hypothetical protein
MTPTTQLGWSGGFAAPSYWHNMPGMGDARPITDAIGSGLLSAGGVIAAIPGGQLPGAIVAAVGALTRLIGGMFQPDITKIQATHIVDQIEAQVLKPMLADWQSLPASAKTPTLQAAYLEVFDSAWKNVRQGCSNPALATAGQNCVTDRQQGACHWTVDGQTPGVPPNCGNWFVWFRDPIANDPEVAANVSASEGQPSYQTGSTPSGTPAATPTDNTKLYLGLGLLAAGVVLAFVGEN